APGSLPLTSWGKHAKLSADSARRELRGILQRLPAHRPSLAARPITRSLQPQLVELVAQLRKAENVRPPERVVLAPVDGPMNLLLGAPVLVEHQAGGVAPPLRDGRPLRPVGLDPIGEVIADSLDVVARRRFIADVMLFYGRVGSGRVGSSVTNAVTNALVTP